MMGFAWIMAAVGWSVAAFMAGFLVGMKLHGKKRESPSTSATEEKAEQEPPTDEATQRKIERARRELRNFLSYDGGEQHPADRT